MPRTSIAHLQTHLYQERYLGWLQWRGISLGNWCLYSTWRRWSGLFTDLPTNIPGSIKSYSGIVLLQRHIKCSLLSPNIPVRSLKRFDSRNPTRFGFWVFIDLTFLAELQYPASHGTMVGDNVWNVVATHLRRLLLFRLSIHYRGPRD